MFRFNSISEKFVSRLLPCFHRQLAIPGEYARLDRIRKDQDRVFVKKRVLTSYMYFITGSETDLLTLPILTLSRSDIIRNYNVFFVSYHTKI